MHDLIAIYNRVKRILKREGKEYFVFGENQENTRFYPNAPKLSDLGVISLSIAAECVQIDSENLPWSKLETDYPDFYKSLPHRTRFNSRRKRLRELLVAILSDVSDRLSKDDEYLIIDSMPLPTCKIMREKQSKACRRPEYDEVLAEKGYNVILNGFYIGYKMHLIVGISGVYRDLLITPANVHDVAFLKEIGVEDDHLRGKTMLGDRGYIGKTTQLKLFEDVELKLKIPYRANQKEYKKYPHQLKIKRKKIETVFSQLCDEFLIRRNYAKRFKGIEIRILTKITAKTFKQLVNYMNEKPINQTKHSLAA